MLYNVGLVCQVLVCNSAVLKLAILCLIQPPKYGDGSPGCSLELKFFVLKKIWPIIICTLRFEPGVVACNCSYSYIKSWGGGDLNWGLESSWRQHREPCLKEKEEERGLKGRNKQKQVGENCCHRRFPGSSVKLRWGRLASGFCVWSNFGRYLHQEEVSLWSSWFC